MPLHDVAVRTHVWIVAEVRGAVGVAEGEEPQSTEKSDRNGE